MYVCVGYPSQHVDLNTTANVNTQHPTHKTTSTPTSPNTTPIYTCTKPPTCMFTHIISTSVHLHTSTHPYIQMSTHHHYTDSDNSKNPHTQPYTLIHTPPHHPCQHTKHSPIHQNPYTCIQPLNAIPYLCT